ncbi:MotA/TolQ/ExbB proton channel family protein [bacterium]
MIELFQKGGFMMYPILVCSAIALAITIERLIYISSASARNKKFLEEARGVNGGPDRKNRIREIAEETQSPVSNIVRAAIDHIDDSEEKRNTIIWRVGSAQRRDLEKFVNTLGVIAHVTPLMGLLGTVIGMIRAFMTIQALGGQVDATDLAGGISEALITTAAGLIVAIPAMIFYHFIQGRVDNVETEMKDSAIDFPEIMGQYRMSSKGNGGSNKSDTAEQ